MKKHIYKYALLLAGQLKTNPQSLAVCTDVSPYNKYLAEITFHSLRSVRNSLGSRVLSGCSFVYIYYGKRCRQHSPACVFLHD